LSLRKAIYGEKLTIFRLNVGAVPTELLLNLSRLVTSPASYLGTLSFRKEREKGEVSGSPLPVFRRGVGGEVLSLPSSFPRRGAGGEVLFRSISLSI
jgi:hypothetical protein